jgi:hypothetical protein
MTRRATEKIATATIILHLRPSSAIKQIAVIDALNNGLNGNDLSSEKKTRPARFFELSTKAETKGNSNWEAREIL